MILFNPILTSVTELDSLNYTTITHLSISNNSMLSNCTTEMICNYLIAGGTYYLANNASGCSDWVYQNCIGLPVEMATPLRIRLQNQTTILTWHTETETNNSGFEIQRSKDGINWEKIGWQAGQGTTTTSHTYTHRDTKPFFGTSYYRLKQVDFDGQFEYSNIVSLRYDKSEGITVYPLPAKDFVVFDVPNIATADEIILHDTAGREIIRQAFPQDKRIAVSHLNNGVYIYRIFCEGKMYSGKIIVE